MSTRKLKGKDLRKIGYKNNQAISLAIEISSKHWKHLQKAERLEILWDVLNNSKDFENHEFLAPLAELFLDKQKEQNFNSYDLEDNPKPYKVYGKQFIDQTAMRQMDTAMKLPVTEKGALMPDCHIGYGLPIGGVLATKNEVIPYGVGLDIGCRMALSILDYPATEIHRNRYPIKKVLQENTFFGVGKIADKIMEHEVLDRAEFNESKLLKELQSKAANQIGTSGSGNHFVEFGVVELIENNTVGIPPGEYLGLLSHSGSRGFGATIAQYFTKVAMDVCRLPREAQHLAWLDLDSPEGYEYWMSMNLAGDYAKACHDIIHQRLIKALGLTPLGKIENHHNFAWKEQINGEEFIVHRKGATPAKEGEFGIIPGSMAAPGYIVSGCGKAEALNSASHGAGRKLSRKAAKESFTRKAMKDMLKKKRVELIGGGLDEAPIAYKNIDDVMAMQKNLVNVEGKFYPKIVRMNKD